MSTLQEEPHEPAACHQVKVLLSPDSHTRQYEHQHGVHTAFTPPPNSPEMVAGSGAAAKLLPCCCQHRMMADDAAASGDGVMMRRAKKSVSFSENICYHSPYASPHHSPQKMLRAGGGGSNKKLIDYTQPSSSTGARCQAAGLSESLLYIQCCQLEI